MTIGSVNNRLTQAKEESYEFKTLLGGDFICNKKKKMR